MSSSSDDELVVKFMAAFTKLREIDPGTLRERAAQDPVTHELCLDVWLWASQIGFAEGSRPRLFTAPVNPQFLAYWREFQARFVSPVVAVFLGEPDIQEADNVTQPDALKLKNEIAAYSGRERVASIENVFAFAEEQIDGQFRDFPETVEEEIKMGISEWRRLKQEVGLDLEGIVRRRELVPFVMVPRHVAKHYGDAEKLSLYTLLDQAQQAFVYGVPFGSVALMRSILELVLTKHYDAKGKNLEGYIKSVRPLPDDAKPGKLHKLRTLANGLLHFEKDKFYWSREHEMQIVANPITLRTLIEEAPVAREGKRF